MIDSQHPSDQFRLLLSTWQSLSSKIDPKRSRLTLRTRTLYWLNSAVQSLLHKLQKKSFQDDLAKMAPPAPIFVLGFWRSGTTFLHELLCCDSRFGFPSTYACLNPAHFLLSGRRVLQGNLREAARPMDDLRYTWASPQEDEFALLSLGAPSPYEALIVPSLMNNAKWLLDLRERPGEDQEQWSDTFDYFLKLLTLEQKKTMVLKSPTHGYRMRTLQSKFEQARFVIIERNPYEVFASNLKLWRTLTSRYALECCSDRELEQFILDAYVLHQNAVSQGMEHCVPGYVCEVRYEDLVKDPIEQISRIYTQLNMEDFETVRPRLDEYLKKVSTHQRNRLRISRSQKTQVDARWGEIIKRREYHWPENSIDLDDSGN